MKAKSKINKTVEPENPSQSIKQAKPQIGCSFVPILSKPVKKRFENKNGADTRSLLAAQKLLETQFDSFDLSSWYQVTKSQPYEAADLQAYFEDFTEEGCRTGKLNKINGAGDLPIYEVC